MEPVQIITFKLSEIKAGEEGIIFNVLGDGAFRKRITEMGFVRGAGFKVLKNAPWQDPVEYKIMDYNVSLRRSEAEMIEVVLPEMAEAVSGLRFEGTIEELVSKTRIREKGKTIHLALVGNPNSGKTTLYNFASGAHERVGNYSGVTTGSHETSIKRSDYTFTILDLPGTYSITEYTPEELFVRKHLMEDVPDIVINVIDASNLERNLYLTTQLIDMNIKVIIALNMYDELQGSGAKLDYPALGRMLGIPIIPTVASRGKGIDELFDKIIDVYEDQDPTVRHIHINYGELIENSISKLQSLISENHTAHYSARYLAIKLLEADKTSLNILSCFTNFEKIKTRAKLEIATLEQEFNEKSETVITDSKYGFIAGALRKTYQAGNDDKRRHTEAIDKILTHQYLGLPFFILFIWLMFQTTFTIGHYPMEWIDILVKQSEQLAKELLPNGMLKDLIIDGIISGIGGVIIFLPNILILFSFISLMEDTGYMARASFMMDHLMHKIGLHGKSFIPLVMGFGCNVPAVMATRTLETRKDRIMTMMIIPFMSCSARLPVYVLLISAFFPRYQGLVLTSIYIVGIVLAVLSSLMMRKYIFKEKDVPFVMELPPYRIPTLRNTSIHIWHKGSQYLKKMGSVILLASVLIWALGYFPRNVEYSKNFEHELVQIKTQASWSASQKTASTKALEMQREAEKQENSYIGKLGHWIEPVIAPLGFDWKIGVSILTGLAAKEIVVSTMGVLYQANEGGEGNSLQNKFKEQTHARGKLKGEKVLTPLVAYTLMLFVLIYFPCVAVVAAIRKEANLKWAMLVTVYTTAVAWLISFACYQIGSIFI